MRVTETRGVLRGPAPFLEQLSFERELIDEVRAVAISDEQRTGRRPRDVARHELAVTQAELLRRRELAHDLTLGRQQSDATLDRGRVPALGGHVPAGVDVHQILHAIFLEDLQAMPTAEASADRPDIPTILLEDDEIVLRVVGDEIDAAGLIFGERM